MRFTTPPLFHCHGRPISHNSVCLSAAITSAPDFDRDEDGSSVLSTSIFIKTDIVHFTDCGGTLTIERAGYTQSKGRPVLFRERVTAMKGVL
jgi:hypothetical protein